MLPRPLLHVVPPPPPTPCPTSAWPLHKGRGCSAHWWHRLGSVCYHRRTLAQLMTHRWCTLAQLMTHRWCKHYRLLPSQAQVSAADCCQSLPSQNYCQNFIQSLLSHRTGRWKTLVKLQGKSSTWKLENWSVWRRLLLERHLEYNLLVRSFSRAETIFGSKGRDATSAECLPDPLTPLGALPHILFPWIFTMNGHRVIYGVGRTGSTDRHRVIYGVGQWTG